MGHADFNHEQAAHHNAPISLGRYLSSSAFLVDVMENWQSEYLQFTLFILATVWLVQRGRRNPRSPERRAVSPTTSRNSASSSSSTLRSGPGSVACGLLSIRTRSCWR